MKALLLHFGSFIPPATSLTSSVTPTVTKIPKEVLTEEFLEEIKTRVCFVGERLDPSLGEEEVEEAEAEAIPMDTGSDNFTGEEYEESNDLIQMNRLEKLYSKNSTTTTISFKVLSLSLGPVISGVGRGWIEIPGWIRERAAEVLFEEGDEDELSLTEVILETLLRVRYYFKPSCSLLSLNPRLILILLLATSGPSKTSCLFHRLNRWNCFAARILSTTSNRTSHHSLPFSTSTTSSNSSSLSKPKS